MAVAEQIKWIGKRRVNELLLQSVRLLEELDEMQKNSTSNMIDVTVANKRLKEALSNCNE